MMNALKYVFLIFSILKNNQNKNAFNNGYKC